MINNISFNQTKPSEVSQDNSIPSLMPITALVAQEALKNTENSAPTGALPSAFPIQLEPEIIIASIPFSHNADYIGECRKRTEKDADITWLKSLKLKDLIPHGKGKVILFPGERRQSEIIGYLLDGRPDMSKEIFVDTETFTYTGEHLDFKRHGKGRFTRKNDPNEYVLDGFFREGEVDTTRNQKITLSGGRTYVGMCDKEGTPYGKGFMIYREKISEAEWISTLKMMESILIHVLPP